MKEQHLGKKIHAVMTIRGKNAVWLASEIGCERTNVYNIFHRRSIDTELLKRICIILSYNFFHDLSEDVQREFGHIDL